MNLKNITLRGLRFLLPALFALSAHAGVTINFVAGQLYEVDETPLAHGSLVLLISDTMNDGFGDLVAGSLGTGSFIDGLDDLILARATVNTGFGNSSVQGILPDSSFYGNWNVGDPLALVWFSTLNGASTELSVGTSYGLFTTNTPADDSDSWVTPASGLISLRFNTEANGGPYAEALGRTSFTVSAIPEPSTYAALFGALALGFAAWRRSRRST